MNLASYFANHLSHGMKRFVHDLIGASRYLPHEDTIENIANLIKNEKEYKKIGELFVEVFEAGYMKSVEDHKKELEKYGLKVNLKLTNQKNLLDNQ